MITEDQLEQLCLSWFAETGYEVVSGYDIAPGEPAAERADYRQVTQGKITNVFHTMSKQLTQ